MIMLEDIKKSQLLIAVTLLESVDFFSCGGADKNLDQILGLGDCHVFVQTKEESC